MKALNLILISVGLINILLGIFVIKEDHLILLGCAIIGVATVIDHSRKKK